MLLEKNMSSSLGNSFIDLSFFLASIHYNRLIYYEITDQIVFRILNEYLFSLVMIKLSIIRNHLTTMNNNITVVETLKKNLFSI